MLVTITETKEAAVDEIGIRVETLRKGETRDLPDTVAARLIGRGIAAAAPEEKALGAAPENKQTPAARPSSSRARRARTSRKET